MSKIIIDASVVVKWFINEKYSDHALELRKAFVSGQMQLFAPDLIPYEVLNALKYSQLFQPQELKTAITSFENYGIIQFPLSGSYAQHVAKIAGTNDISVYDASYVGLIDVVNARLCTADKRLIEKLSKYKEKIVFIKDFVKK